MKMKLWLTCVASLCLVLQTVAADATNKPPPAAKAALPKLVDLGAGKCMACKMMTTVLDDLKKNHADQFQVEFIDVWEQPDAAKPYKINLIPTQIFLAADGKELFRHEGFFSKADILAKWKELGVNVVTKPAGK
jgi:thioredoxin 1